MTMLKIIAFLIALTVPAFAQVPMTGAGKGAPGGGGGGCSQATSLIARMDGSQNTNAVTNLICGMVTDGTFALMDTFYVFAINSSTNAALNWVSSSFSITVNGTCTFTANTGYTGDGSSCFLGTGYNPATSGTNYTQNSANIGICNLNTTANAETLMGESVGGITIELGFSASATFYDVNDNTFPSFTFTNTSGLWNASRTGASTMALYLNGSSVATSTAASSAIPSANIDILASNNAGTAIQFSTGKIGVTFAGGGLNATQANNVRSRVNTYLTAVGAPAGC